MIQSMVRRYSVLVWNIRAWGAGVGGAGGDGGASVLEADRRQRVT